MHQLARRLDALELRAAPLIQRHRHPPTKFWERLRPGVFDRVMQIQGIADEHGWPAVSDRQLLFFLTACEISERPAGAPVPLHDCRAFGVPIPCSYCREDRMKLIVTRRELWPEIFCDPENTPESRALWPTIPVYREAAISKKGV